jgi:hypothetical protein
MMKATLATLGAAALVLATTHDAHAAGQANGFGGKHTLIISADRLVPLVGYTSSSVELNGALPVGATRSVSTSASGMSFLWGSDFSSYSLLSQSGTIQPLNVHSLPRVAFDFAVIEHLTIGAGLAFGFGFGGSNEVATVNGPNSTTTNKVDSPSSFAFGFAPRVGYVIPFGEHLAFWPRAGMGIYSINFKQETRDQTNNVTTTFKSSDFLFSLDLDPQLAIIPTEHFFFTIGPMLNIPLTGNRSLSGSVGGATTTTDQDISLFHFGIHATVGGWVF